MMGLMRAQGALVDQRTAAFGFGEKAASVMVPRRRPSASLSARSSFSSGGTIGLRARFFGAFRFEVTAERGLAFDIGACLLIGGHLLEHLYVRLNAFRLD
jgi:hypothetical protein